jgi:TonB family protein
MSWAHYLLQVNIYLIIFYCFYRLLLDNETYFVLNRLYLVLSGVFSLAIPFLRFELFSEKVVSDKLYLSISELNTVVTNYAILPQTQEQYDWGRLIVMVYLLGVLIYLLHFAYQLFAVNQLFNNTNTNNAFSFFNRKSVAHNLPERATVDLHEDIHIKQLHTIDVIFFELLAIITWFNPVIYLYKKSIKNIHEYLADEAAAKFQGDKEAYAILLLSRAFGVSPNTLTNGFFTKSLIKKRIFMLHKQRSKKIAILKYGLFLPLFAITLVLSSATIRKNNQLWAIADNIPLDEANNLVAQAIEQPLSIVNLEAQLPTKLDQIQVQQLLTKDDVASTFKKEFSAEKQNENLWNEFYKYLGEGIKYPAEAVKKKVQGNTVINFTVRRGKATEIFVQNELGAGCDEEVIEQVANYDDFFQKDGNYTLKVSFKLEGAETQFKNENITVEDGYTALQHVMIMAYAAKEENTSSNFISLANPPIYPGGIQKLYDYISKTIKYPIAAADNEIEGTVLVSFIVEKDGTLSNYSIDKKLGFGIDEEALRVIKLSKKWMPGFQNGKMVRAKYTLPIKFSLDSKQQKPSKANIVASVRLKNSTDTNQPLYILDGELKEASIINELDAKKIESINVLKDASATALYGKKAEFGAILITTKKPEKPKVSATIFK